MMWCFWDSYLFLLAAFSVVHMWVVPEPGLGTLWCIGT